MNEAKAIQRLQELLDCAKTVIEELLPKRDGVTADELIHSVWMARFYRDSQERQPKGGELVAPRCTACEMSAINDPRCTQFEHTCGS